MSPNNKKNCNNQSEVELGREHLDLFYFFQIKYQRLPIIKEVTFKI